MARKWPVPAHQAGELYQDERGLEIEAMVGPDQQVQMSTDLHRRQAGAQDVDEPSAPGDPTRYNRND